MEIYPNFRDLFGAFAAADVRYLLVGGYAVAFHGRPRFTKDLDLWVDDSEDNLSRVQGELDSFGAPDGFVEALRLGDPLDVACGWASHRRRSIWSKPFRAWSLPRPSIVGW